MTRVKRRRVPGTMAMNDRRKDDVRGAVLATIASIAPDTDVQRIRPDQPLRQQIDLDSMDWLNVMVDLGDRLSIQIPESAYGRLATLDSIVDYVVSRRAEPVGGPSGTTVAAPAGLPCTHRSINGIPVAFRPMRADDMPLEADFVRHLSSEARYKRFMGTLNELSQAKLRYLTDVDQVRHVALVATVDRGGQELMVGVVRYVVDAAGTGCDFAVAVDDAWQGSGLAGILMRALMDVARSRGLTTITGEVLARNARMLKFMGQLGFGRHYDPEARDTVRVVRRL